jgi:DNA phosphorothioation-dependent restriction protein DptG
MAYFFEVETFKESFNAKTGESKSIDSMRLIHKADNHFKLFPYKASGKIQAPIVTDLEDVVSGFFRFMLNKKTETIKVDELCDALLEEVDVEEDEIDYFKDLVQSMFFKGEDFVANNIGLYPYQTRTNNKSADNLARFLYSVLGINKQDCEKIERLKAGYRFNVLENMVINTIEARKVSEAEENVPYFWIKDDIQKLFRDDFYFMLETGMTSLDDFANLFAVYYFFYVSQTCIVLDHFCSGKRDDKIHFYYALDWEKVSKNRLCCIEGWEKLQGSISHMYSHAITLEILNQTKGKNMLDYIAFGQMVCDDPNLDREVADEIARAEEIYCSYIGDYKGFSGIPIQQGTSKTEEAIRHLYKCVEAQFLNTERKRANQFYNEKFSEFCKYRWVKNRKKSGLVLNLTERDIIFLTKICLRNKEKIRLIDLYKEYEYRGIYMDNTSKEYLQEFFTRLNLIDKKSDSGDAQYVKRIL